MKVLVATSQTQGQSDEDFCYTVEGENVRTCPIEKGAFVGSVSHKGSTTAKVADVDMTDEDYKKLQLSSWESAYGEGGVKRAWINRSIAWLLDLASAYPEGTILGINSTGDIEVRYEM